MIRRLFWALMGLGFGVVMGARVVRRVDRVAEAARPGSVAAAAGRRAGTTTTRFTRAWVVGREHARQREAELRDRFGVPTLEETASGDLAGRRAAARP